VKGSGFSYHGLVREISDVFIHPGSSLFGYRSPRIIVVNEMVETSKLYARGCSAVSTEWLPELLPSSFTFGEGKLLSYARGDTAIPAEREVLLKRAGGATLFDVCRMTVSIEEARYIQDERVEKAEREGLIPLRFYGKQELIAQGSRIKYRLSGFSSMLPEEGKLYYCLTERDYRYGGFVATPQFQVFEFSEPEVPSGGEEVSERSLQALAAKWSGSKK
jgi:hypothetical protein